MRTTELVLLFLLYDDAHHLELAILFVCFFFIHNQIVSIIKNDYFDNIEKGSLRKYNLLRCVIVQHIMLFKVIINEESKFGLTL